MITNIFRDLLYVCPPKAAKWLVCIALFTIHYPLFISCSDWDDHFNANTSVLESQNTTLWKNIERNGNLTQFAEILRRTGYDQRLDASQTYTVWAPEDDTFDYQTLLGYDNERLVKEFVENHIARNNYPASGETDKDVYMLNEKKITLTNGTFTTTGHVPSPFWDVRYV